MSRLVLVPGQVPSQYGVHMVFVADDGIGNFRWTVPLPVQGLAGEKAPVVFLHKGFHVPKMPNVAELGRSKQTSSGTSRETLKSKCSANSP